VIAETELNQPKRCCETCEFCHREPAHGGVQVVNPTARYACVVEPVKIAMVPGEGIRPIRGCPTNPTDPACRDWRRLKT
jgi:hypothetical protein